MISALGVVRGKLAKLGVIAGSCILMAACTSPVREQVQLPSIAPVTAPSARQAIPPATPGHDALANAVSSAVVEPTDATIRETHLAAGSEATADVATGSAVPAAAPVAPQSPSAALQGQPTNGTQASQGATPPAAAENRDEQGEFVPGHLLVRFDQRLSDAERQSLLATLGVKSRELVSKSAGVELLVLNEGVSVKAVQKQMQTLKGVQSADPDYYYYADAIPGDTSFGQLWGMHNIGQSGGTVDIDINAPEAWDVYTGDRDDVVVAVIDTGIDYTHNDLKNNMWRNPGEIAGNAKDDDGNGYVDDVYGIDTVNNDTNPMDDHYHGTHCAGTIGAEGDNALGVAGVAWQAKIMACKFLSSGGSGSTTGAIKCLDYLYDLKVNRGINLALSSNSWGGGGFSAALEASIIANRNAGILFVAAAGNSSRDNDSSPNYPSNYNVDNIIAVAAIDRNGNLASFSNYGKTTVDIGAPGVDVYSTKLSNTYGNASGTSMATPHVSGMLALYKMDDPTLTWQELKQKVFDNGVTLPSLTNKTVTGKLPKLVLSGKDEDGDGLPTPWEKKYGLNPDDPSDAWTDGDSDGLMALQEYKIKTDPTKIDTDGDGLSDGNEATLYGTDPLVVDSDQDGLTDGAEITIHQSNPILADTDNDGMLDAFEVAHGFDPGNKNDDLIDSDGDGWTNEQEYAKNTNPKNPASKPAGPGSGKKAAMLYSSSYVDTSREAPNMRTVAINAGYDVATFTGIDATSLQTALTGKNMLIIPELEVSNLFSALTPAAKTVIQNFVSDGGGLYLAADYYANDVTFLNGMFGFSLSSSATGVVASLNTAAAAGTPFASAPTTLSNSDGTYPVTSASLPSGALNLYTISGLTTVFAKSYGSGKVVFGGFDWWTTPAPNDWIAVFGKSLEYIATPPDADGDGMPDSWEDANGLNKSSAADALTDKDGDGLINLQEYLNKSDPGLVDTDNDGLNDGQEVMVRRTNPLLGDTDADGLTDSYEVTNGLNPLLKDTDDDGMADGWESSNSYDSKDPADGALDSDNDGVINFVESLALTNPKLNTSKPAPGFSLYSLAGAAGTTSSSPALSKDQKTIYITNQQGVLSALSVNGTVKWSFSTGKSISDSSPVVGEDGTIYQTTDTNYLYAISPDGKLRWRYLALGSLKGISVSQSDDGLIYFGDDYGRFYTVQPSGPLLSYKQHGGSFANSKPAIGPKTVYVNNPGKNQLVAFDRETGALKWQYTFANKVMSQPVVDSSDNVSVGSNDGYINSLDSNGNLVWRYNTGAAVAGSLALDADGNVYAGARNARLYALTAAGALRWSFLAAGNIDSTPALGANGSIFVGSQDSKLRALNPDGSLKWSYTAAGAVNASPTPSDVGIVYAASLDGRLHAVYDGAAGMDLGAQWGMYGGNPQHTGYGVCNETSPDTDADEMPDCWERRYGLNPDDPLDSDLDLDMDGASNHYEFASRTNPADPDTDDDGLKDGEEIFTYLTDPVLPDTDGDDLKDGEEIKTYHTNPHIIDTDGDSLTDGYEAKTLGTNPLKVDTDGDTMSDGYEVTHGLNPLVDDRTLDLDGDGLSNFYEFQHGTDPSNLDTDDDGMSDGYEVSKGFNPLDTADGAYDADTDTLSNVGEYLAGTDPFDADSDDDDLSDGYEVHVAHTKPLKKDTDGDGLNDGDEVNNWLTDPNDVDTDDDSLSDGAEALVHGTNPLLFDTDGDTLGDGDEMLVHGTNPLNVDTDGDTMTDDYELANGFNPLVHDGLLDSDADGLPNFQEFRIGSDPVNPDTDGDTLVDGNEVNIHRSSPLLVDTDRDTLNDSWEVARIQDAAQARYVVTTGIDGHACALTDSGVQCWGNDTDGQSSPPALTNPTHLVSGDSYSCARDNDSWNCWGFTADVRAVLPAVSGTLREVASSAWHGCLIDDSGVKCWGHDWYGGTSVPVGLVNPRSITTSVYHSCVIDDKGAHCWGTNTGGQLDVPPLVKPTHIAAGRDFTCAIDASGVVCWGDNSYGQLDVPALTDPLMLSASAIHMCAVSDEGITCWGENASGQNDVPALVNPAQVAVGWGGYSCGLDETGVVCWGSGITADVNEQAWIDTDADGMPSNYEVKHGFDRLDPDDALADADDDGLNNLGEYLNRTDPFNKDSDGDGMSDGYEVANGLDPLVDDASLDADGDGLDNLIESQIGTSSKKADTDGDGMPDKYEHEHGTDPLLDDAAVDADADGLVALKEYQAGTDLFNPDTDGDRVTDGDEVLLHGTNPLVRDTDGDGFPDSFELAHGLNPLDLADGLQDHDSDGMPSGGEYRWGLDYLNPDDAGADRDNDGFTSVREYELGMSPVLAQTHIATNWYHVCALDNSSVTCWGDNAHGQTDVPALDTPIQVVTGLYHSCALDANGVTCWGSDNYGQSTVPELVNPVMVSAGAYHGCAIDDTGVVCWGANHYGQATPTPVLTPYLLASGNFHTCAVDHDGTHCWGFNGYQQIETPADLGDVIALDLGDYHSCAIDQTGLVCWGYNAYKQAVVPATLADPRLVAAGNHHNCAIDGSNLECWGRNDSGQTNVPGDLVLVRQAAAGNKYNCVLDIQGVHCWGGNSHGQHNIPDGLWFDADLDELPDSWEYRYGLDYRDAGNKWMDPDLDTLTNHAEYLLGTNPVQADTDDDGIDDALDPFPLDPALSGDSDGDGIDDGYDNCPGVANAGQMDSDGDGIGDSCDGYPDDPTQAGDGDGDGIDDLSDNCRLQKNADQANYDGDAHGDLCDVDDDNDGRLDLIDDYPLNRAAFSNSDADTHPDSWAKGCDVSCQVNSGLVLDNCPLITNEDQANNDGDAQGDVCDSDDDNDGLSDRQEKVRGTDPFDADTDGDGHSDKLDHFPLDPAEWLDSDGDGVGDNSDEFPLDPDETGDADGDGVGDNADAFPNDPDESLDTDNDGVGDNSDNCPYVANADQLDDDSNGFGNACNVDAGDLLRNYRAGYALALGDFDNDGFDDVVVGTPGFDVNDGDVALRDTGRIQVLSGLNGAVLVEFTGAAKQQLGMAIAVVPDQNADNIVDIVVGEPLADTLNDGKLQRDAGRIALHSGADGQLLGVIATGADAGDRFGAAVAMAATGLVVGSPKADVTSGDALLKDAGVVTALSGVSNTILYTRSGTQAKGYFGAALAFDHLSNDILVGSPGFDVILPVKQTDVGRVDIFDDADGTSEALHAITGGNKGDRLGAALASFSLDLDDADAGVDWIVGVPGADITFAGAVLRDAGRVLLYSGFGDTPTLVMDGDQSRAGYGFALAAGGNLDGDSQPDLVIGTPAQDVTQAGVLQRDAGLVDVLAGSDLF